MIKSFRHTLFVGKEILHLPSCQSTNDTLTQIMHQQSINEGYIVICDEQTQGKGQRGNVWLSAPGENLTFSLLLKPHFLDVSQQFYLNMAISLGIYHALVDYVRMDLCVKWPNDIYVATKKMGGILIENTLRGSMLEHSIVGIGLNINQMKELLPHATSLKAVTGQSLDLEEILQQLAGHIESYYLKLKKLQFGDIKAQYQRLLLGWQCERQFEKEGKIFSAVITGIDDQGRIELKTKQGLQRFGLKEISFVL